MGFALVAHWKDFIAYRRRHRFGPTPDDRLGQLRSTVPVARSFGWDRGKAIDRVFIERFLDTHADRIQGRVLEIGDDSYTRQYGGSRVTRADILHVDTANPRASFVGDLSDCPQIADDLFDCLILTQTLQLVADIHGALGTAHRILKPGGVMLATFPGISQISDSDWGPSWFWGWSCGQARNLIDGAFGDGTVSVEALGNRFACIAMLYGLVAEEVPAERLLAREDGCAFLIGAVAVKAGARATRS